MWNSTAYPLEDLKLKSTEILKSVLHVNIPVDTIFKYNSTYKTFESKEYPNFSITPKRMEDLVNKQAFKIISNV